MQKSTSTLFLLVVLIVQGFFSCFLTGFAFAQSTPNVYFGVDIAYGQTAEAKAAIDRVSSFTNLAIIGSTGVVWFQDRVNETYQYAYDKGLSIISLRPSLPEFSMTDLNASEWYSMAESRWGNRLLGFYVGDEQGGKQLDGIFQYTGGANFSGVPGSYVDAAGAFTAGVRGFLQYTKPPSYYKTITSDYALYWYDFKAGYDVVWTELGGNWSQQVNIALCRGAAEAQGKEWGAIITWSYTQQPYIENATQLYQDLLLAYDNGAKYIIIFDSDTHGHSILQSDHIDAMQKFWSYIQNHQPRSNYPKSERIAYVIPNGYGFGFRWPTDHIWGVWQPDELTPNITKSVGSLLDQYNGKLDILIDDGLQSGNNGYNQLLYWNSYYPAPTPTQLQSPTLTPTSTVTQLSEAPSSTIIIIIVTIVAIIAVASLVFVTYLKKQKDKQPEHKKL